MNTSSISTVAGKLGWPTDGRYGVDEPLRVAVAHLEHCWKAEEEVARRRSDETRMMVGATVVFLSVGLFRFGLDVFRDSGLWLIRVILLLGFLALLGSSWMLIGAGAVPRLRRWLESRGAMYLKRQGREGSTEAGPERWWRWGIAVQSSALLKPDGGEVEGLVEEASRLATPEDAETGDATVRESLVRSGPGRLTAIRHVSQARNRPEDIFVRVSRRRR